MTHTVIVPGVGGSEYDHWQSWLQRQMRHCSRVEQVQWQHPVLDVWVKQFLDTLHGIEDDLQIVAHSFGCLTSIAALAQHPQLHAKIKNLLLVAPANPKRFGPHGFAQDEQNYWQQFTQFKINVPCQMLISENDPWLSFEDAQQLAQHWRLRAINLGPVGHINVASGFGPFPDIYNFLISENEMQHIKIADDDKHLFKFAI